MSRRAKSEMNQPGPVGGLTSVGSSDDSTMLVEALRGRDAEALAVLFDRYGVFVHQVLVRIIGPRDPESSDLLHDTFLRAQHSIGRLKEPKALKSWLHGIAVFTAREWLRSRKRMGHPHLAEAASDRPAVSAAPEARQAVRALYQLLDTFPEEERVAFVLRFVEQMELESIAQLCQTSFSTIRRRIKRAEARFQAALPAYPALAERVRRQP